MDREPQRGDPRCAGKPRPRPEPARPDGTGPARAVEADRAEDPAGVLGDAFAAEEAAARRTPGRSLPVAMVPASLFSKRKRHRAHRRYNPGPRPRGQASCVRLLQTRSAPRGDGDGDGTGMGTGELGGMGTGELWRWHCCPILLCSRVCEIGRAMRAGARGFAPEAERRTSCGPCRSIFWTTGGSRVCRREAAERSRGRQGMRAQIIWVAR